MTWWIVIDLHHSFFGAQPCDNLSLLDRETQWTSRNSDNFNQKSADMDLAGTTVNCDLVSAGWCTVMHHLQSFDSFSLLDGEIEWTPRSSDQVYSTISWLELCRNHCSCDLVTDGGHGVIHHIPLNSLMTTSHFQMGKYSCHCIIQIRLVQQSAYWNWVGITVVVTWWQLVESEWYIIHCAQPMKTFHFLLDQDWPENSSFCFSHLS